MKWIKLVWISCLLMTKIVEAEEYESIELEDPYILTQELPIADINREDCIQLIRGGDQAQEEDESIALKLEDLRAELKELEESYQDLNLQIERLEQGDQDSLGQLNSQMEELIDQIYQEASQLPSFQELAQEDQLDWLSQDDRVLALEEQMNEIENEINHLIAQRDAIESRHQQVAFDIETLEERIIQQEDDKLQQNQCLLYPYSSPYYQDELGLTDMEGSDLGQYLTKIDQKLAKLVPKAYQGVTFANIHQTYQDLLTSQQASNLSINKVPVVFNEAQLADYQYAKEMGLNELQLIASYAYAQYQKDHNFSRYQESYHDLWQLKEEQFLYFVAINEEHFTQIKASLADFLNHKQYTDGTSIAKLKTLHQRYQIKLVIFDQDQGLWQSVPNDQTGFSAEPLLETSPESFASSNSATTSEDQSSSIEEGLISPSEDSIDQHEKLSQLKDKLKKKGKKTPTKNLKHNQAKGKEKPAKKEKDSKPLALPTTGEVAGINRILLGLLIIGLAGVLLIHRHKRRQARKQEDISLD